MKLSHLVWFFLLQGSLLSSEAAQTVKIKNFREIYVSYADIMGVSASDVNLKTLFNEVKDRLPKKGLAQELNSPAIMAMTELSGAFCQAAIAREKNQSLGERILFSSVDFAKPPKQISDYSLESTTRTLSKLFWLREIRSDEALAMKKLFDQVANVNMNDVNMTTTTMHSICVSFATSLAFIVKN